MVKVALTRQQKSWGASTILARTNKKCFPQLWQKRGNKTSYLLACYTATQGERGHLFLDPISSFSQTGMRLLENQLINTAQLLCKPKPFVLKLKKTFPEMGVIKYLNAQICNIWTLTLERVGGFGLQLSLIIRYFTIRTKLDTYFKFIAKPIMWPEAPTFVSL